MLADILTSMLLTGRPDPLPEAIAGPPLSWQVLQDRIAEMQAMYRPVVRRIITHFPLCAPDGCMLRKEDGLILMGAMTWEHLRRCTTVERVTNVTSTMFGLPIERYDPQCAEHRQIVMSMLPPIEPEWLTSPYVPLSWGFR